MTAKTSHTMGTVISLVRFFSAFCG